MRWHATGELTPGCGFQNCLPEIFQRYLSHALRMRELTELSEEARELALSRFTCLSHTWSMVENCVR
jgi:hypothetical protein